MAVRQHTGNGIIPGTLMSEFHPSKPLASWRCKLNSVSNRGNILRQHTEPIVYAIYFWGSLGHRVFTISEITSAKAWPSRERERIVWAPSKSRGRGSIIFTWTRPRKLESKYLVIDLRKKSILLIVQTSNQWRTYNKQKNDEDLWNPMLLNFTLVTKYYICCQDIVQPIDLDHRHQSDTTCKSHREDIRNQYDHI